MATGKDFDERLARFRKLPTFLRVVVSRPRTFIALGVAIVVFLLLPDSLRLVTRAVICDASSAERGGSASFIDISLPGLQPAGGRPTTPARGYVPTRS